MVCFGWKKLLLWVFVGGQSFRGIRWFCGFFFVLLLPTIALAGELRPLPSHFHLLFVFQAFFGKDYISESMEGMFDFRLCLPPASSCELGGFEVCLSRLFLLL